MNLSKRLKTILSYCEGYTTLADIGSDHAHLAIAAVDGFVKRAIAIDNKIGPFKKAIKNVLDAKLDHVVECKLSDGIAEIPIDADLIAICGMGGLLITDILNTGIHQLTSFSRTLILQPNNSVPEVRAWLSEHHYAIIQEELLEERGKYYEILVAVPSPTLIPLSEDALTFGPILLKHKNDAFLKKYTNLLVLKKRVLNQMNPEHVDEIKKIVKEIYKLERVLYES